MHAYVNTKYSESNNVQWNIKGKHPMWIVGVYDTAPLLNRLAPWNEDLKWVGIAVDFVDSDNSKSLDWMIVYENKTEDSQHQLQNEWVSGHKQQQVHRRLHHMTQRRMKHVHTQLKQPDKRRQ